MATNGMLPTVGWTPLWSKDRNTLVQLLRDLETGLIVAAWASHRRGPDAAWEPITELGTECQSSGSPS